MINAGSTVDAVIIGGGFYGATIAIYLAKQRGLKRVVLVERESALLTRASYNNQARIHNGYHYPRSFTTAYRSRVNLPHFVRDWPGAVEQDFTKLYAITRRNSKVTAKQFVRFCKEIGAKIEPANQSQRQLFESRLIEEVFLVEEYVFDSGKLADWAEEQLRACDADVRYETRVTAISRADHAQLKPSCGKKTEGNLKLSAAMFLIAHIADSTNLRVTFPERAPVSNKKSPSWP